MLNRIEREAFYREPSLDVNVETAMGGFVIWAGVEVLSGAVTRWHCKLIWKKKLCAKGC